MSAPSGAAYCSACGAAVTGRFCSSCGASTAPQAGGYQSSPAWQPATALQGTNGLAIGALVAAFFVPPAAVVLGLIAKSQIRRTGEAGDGLATAAIVIGLISSIFFVFMLAMVVNTQHGMFPSINGPGGTFP